eukprot:scaffold1231_cov107-Cylindrotheca_fusiformis.AAC.10
MIPFIAQADPCSYSASQHNAFCGRTRNTRLLASVMLLVLQTSYFASVNSFPQTSPMVKFPSSRSPAMFSLFASTVESENSGEGRERTLYDILEASPTDSQQQLREKYRALVRQTHPDAVDSGKEQAAIQFAEIAAAWNILSNPKERLRYDRTMKAKEFTNQVEDILEGGFRAAFERAYQTAGEIQNVGAQLDQVRSKAKQRLEMASKITEYRNKSRTLQQRANREASRQRDLQLRLSNRQQNRWLQDLQNEPMTSAMATEVLKNFQQYDNLPSSENNSGFGFGRDAGLDKNQVAATIERLNEMEQEYRQTTVEYQKIRKALTSAQRKIELAVSEEERAYRKLLEAQAQLEQAQSARQESEDFYGQVLQAERVAFSQMERSESSLAKQKDRTRETLRRTEDLFIWKENAYLKEEAQQAEILSQKLQTKAEELQIKADELKREMDSI